MTLGTLVIRFMFSRGVFVLRIACARIDHSFSRRRRTSRVYYIKNATHLMGSERVDTRQPGDFTCRPRRFSRAEKPINSGCHYDLVIRFLCVLLSLRWFDEFTPSPSFICFLGCTQRVRQTFFRINAFLLYCYDQQCRSLFLLCRY